MRLNNYFLTFLVACSSAFSLFADPTKEDMFVMLMSDILNDFPDLNDDDFKMRLDALSGEIDYRLDPLVKDRIIARIDKARSSTEKLFGKSDIYFPIFEEYLAKYNVPHHVKYLSIVESALVPNARSHAGAGGLWQFMPGTAKMYGMQISSIVDERSDTHKASESAAKMLSELYKYYGDWSLAMAAYNCGPGRVNNAVKKAGCKDYWKVRAFLPTETQKYVPYFMATVYVGEYAYAHDLKLEAQAFDLAVTDTLHLRESLTFQKIAQTYGVSLDTVKILNPSYLKNYLPRTNTHHTLVLPASAVAQVRGYEQQLAYVRSIQTENPLRTVRRVSSEKEVEALAKAYRCTVKDILNWNNLPANHQFKANEMLAIRKFAGVKDGSNTAPRPVIKTNQSIQVLPLYLLGLKNQKAITTTAQTRTHSHSSSHKSEPTKTATTQISAMPTAETPQQGDISHSRDRERRLRTETKTEPKPAVASTPTPSTATSAPLQTMAPAPAIGNGKKAEEISGVQKWDETAQPRGRQNARTTPVVLTTEAAPAVSTETKTAAEPVRKSTDNFKYHCVAPNETIWDIRKSYPQVTTREILETNRLRSESDIHVGLMLKIPVK
jgi:membrane-bound lytic murein transglycosylase D